MAKINFNAILKGVMYGILLHVAINVLLPKLKTLDFTTMFNVGAQPSAPTAPAPAPAAPEGITPATPPAEGGEEEEDMGEEEEEEEDYE